MNEIINQVNVITAGPSAGKSSLCRELSARGYHTLPEAARILFDQRISEGDDPEEVRQEDDFHKQVEFIDREIESQLGGNRATFLDRSLADNIAYRYHFGNTDHVEKLESDCKNRYDNIFLLERLEFQDDEVRSEDEEEARCIHEDIRAAYEGMEYDVIEVPLMEVNKRANFVEEKIAHSPPIH